MNGERRSDIGNKVLVGLISTLVIVIMGFSIQVASKANDKASANKISIRGMEVEQKYTREAIQEMKLDIREIKQAVVK